MLWAKLNHILRRSVTESAKQRFLAKVSSRELRVAVIGLGYVGLPLVKAMLDARLRVLGFDTNGERVAMLGRGESYIPRMNGPWLQSAVDQRRFEVSEDLQRVREADAVIVCVPTPLTDARSPDLSHVCDAVDAVAAELRPGQLVCLESTTYPTTTRDVVLPALARSGLQVGRDFFLAYSPEREDPGNGEFHTENIPRVVGGCDPDSTEVAVAFYHLFLNRVVPVANAETAEASKILENTYRAVNIALVNEFKTLCHRLGIDVWEVIHAASTKPFGYQPFFPGPGLGGHCIPIDPFYLTWLARKHGLSTRFIELAGQINTDMPRYVIERVAYALNEQKKSVNGSRIAILGAAYKPDIEDTRESPSFPLLELLEQRHALVSYNDPHVPSLSRPKRSETSTLVSQPLTERYLAAQDCVLLATAHSSYDYAFIARHAALVVDPRNAFRHAGIDAAHIVQA